VQGARGRWLERGLGIALGLVLGVAVVAAFVFLGSEDTIDAPRITGVPTGAPPAAPAPRPGLPHGVPLVRINGGAPPPSGPPRLVFRRGERVRFGVLSDIPLTLQVLGYGVSRDVSAGRSAISFRASRAGQFPVVVSFSHINVALLRVRR
jgi:hypothetical protein